MKRRKRKSMSKVLLVIGVILLYFLLGLFVWFTVQGLLEEADEFSDVDCYMLGVSLWPLLVIGLLLFGIIMVTCNAGLAFGIWLRKFKKEKD